MRNGKAIDWIVNYIKEQKISVRQTALDLRIPESKLQSGSKEELSTEEFFKLCQYLNVTPEEIRKEIN